MTEANERLARGRAARERIHGAGSPPGTPATSELAPYFSQWIYESVFGDLYARGTLDLKNRVLVTMAALSALGRGPQLRGYIKGALRLGWSREEIVEAIVQLAPYQGVPLTHDALGVAKEVFDAEKAK